MRNKLGAIKLSVLCRAVFFLGVSGENFFFLWGNCFCCAFLNIVVFCFEIEVFQGFIYVFYGFSEV